MESGIPYEMDGFGITAGQEDWLDSKLEGWTVSLEKLSPSEWAEMYRYLPPSVTSLPGYFSWDVTPFFKEVVDCLSPDSPIRELAVMKGVQVSYTTAVLENGLGFAIAHIKTAPCLLVTADAELANLRMTSNITPMIQHSGLSELIQSDDDGNNRKTGKTDKKISWQGGGYLVPYGAVNANKLRSMSARYLFCDEDDGWPLIVGRDGDPHVLVKDRTAAYEESRKILYGSTPTIKGASAIEKLFLRGDQRYYFVNCVSCGHAQRLRWRREDPKTGEVTGMTWTMTEDGERLIPGSVRYLCSSCGHPHANDDKRRLLDPAHGAEWRPTATPVAVHVRSYHISALYSPVGMQSWEECVQKYLDAWDMKTNRCKDTEKLQVFYNNVLGETFELRGEKLRFAQVSPHRRAEYQRGQIPNLWAAQVLGSPILFLVCTVDVQKDWLAVGVFGFAAGARSIVVDYFKFEGDCTDPDDPKTWGRLRELIETKEYVADDGKRYKLILTCVDSGYLTGHVYAFVGEYQSGVICLKGREGSPAGSNMRHFAALKGSLGAVGYSVHVDIYKERLQAALRHSWDGIGRQPERHFNAPSNIRDDELKELTVETKREKIDRTGKRVGWYWYRPNGSRNELWDLAVYAYFAHDALAFDVCPPDEKKGVFLVDWITFYDSCEGGLFFQ